MPTAYVISQANGISVPGALSGAPGTSGNFVQVTLKPAALKAGQKYTLLVVFWVTSSVSLASLTTLNVVV